MKFFFVSVLSVLLVALSPLFAQRKPSNEVPRFAAVHQEQSERTKIKKEELPEAARKHLREMPSKGGLLKVPTKRKTESMKLN